MIISKELKVHYYLRHKEVKGDGATPIMGRITIGKSMVQFSAKCSVQVSLWDTKSARATGKSKAAAELNRKLDKISLSIHSHYKELLAKKENVSPEEVKNAFQGIASEQETLIGYCNRYNHQLTARIGVNITLESYKRYGVSFNHLRRFLRTKYNLSDISFQALDYSFVEAFDFYLRVQLKFKPNTIVGIIGHLKIIIKRAINEGIITCDPFAGFSLEGEPLQPKSLTKQELHKIMTTPLDTPNRYLVRDMFLFSVFTGISFSDIRNLTYSNLVQAEDGVWWIHSKRRKTGTEFHVPLLELPLQIIEKYRGLNKDGKMFVMLSCSKTNGNLKKIARMCGIKRNITYHQARHSYASLITLSQGVPMETVSRMLGHRDLRATRIYAQVSNEKINTDMRKLEKRITNKYHLAD
ncbi:MULTISPECIES: site-specific integrase [unclassified Bacteroides]|jgi:integrase/recombinase XerD|uniref:site-specific integrase n=1 Tax=unclassified Bacteroides TaxID=2646097 RepID=UPI000E7F171A|nr:MULTISPECIES: site-specific integrase [unclassified Bacteroides]RGN42835.1 site-specific integrase [Bacteroides sp. OM05-12]RHR69972.1 site-specific integrase [Bacteroides sp. AF16-49]